MTCPTGTAIGGGIKVHPWVRYPDMPPDYAGQPYDPTDVHVVGTYPKDADTWAVQLYNGIQANPPVELTPYAVCMTS
jgi:hypothetical protein